MKKKILELLRKNRQGLTLQRLARELRLLHKEQFILKKKLQSMEDNGVILKERRRYFFLPDTRIIKGKFVSINRGYGFVRPLKAGAKDIFIPARHSAGAILGDQVEVVYKEQNKPEGRILRIIKPGKEIVIGTYKLEHGEPSVLIFDSPQPETRAVNIHGCKTAEPGDIVFVNRESGEIEKVLGKPDDPGVDIQAVAARFELSDSFSEDTIKEARAISRGISPLEQKTRLDFRSWTTVTIDGEDARDFDDAVSIKKSGPAKYLLGVHIADVSFYVRPGSSLDRDAYSKGTSVYFPETSFPMLPDRLSYDVCSLRPGEDKLTFSALLEIDRAGRVLKKDFALSLIRSNARLTYTAVNKIIQGDLPLRKKHSDLVPDLDLMRELSSAMKHIRIESGSLDFDFPEPFLLYKNNALIGITASEINEAHGIIEEFMLAANAAAAELLSEKNFPCLYRVHPAPQAENWAKLRETMACFGYSLPPPNKAGIKDLQAAQDWAAGRSEQRYLYFQILRSLQLAKYSQENAGHFGLGIPVYTHFTSPIRRYPDLLVHRLLKKALAGSDPEGLLSSETADSCSERERKAEAAERELLAWRIFRWLKNKLGEETAGYMVEITKAGVLVKLEEYFVSGMILYQDLGNDYFVPRDACSLRGRRTHRTYRLGDRLQVIIAAVDPDLRRITLVPASLLKKK